MEDQQSAAKPLPEAVQGDVETPATPPAKPDPAKVDPPPVKKADVVAPSPSPAPTPPHDNTARATAIYTTWRNARLRGLPTAAFNRIEAESPHLIAAIAAAL